jgi:phosphocarrier protein HPr
MRPCASLVEALRPYRSEVIVEANGHKVSGISLLSLLSLGASPGSEVIFTVTGTDAFAAMAAIQNLFDDCFGEHAASQPAIRAVPFYRK